MTRKNEPKPDEVVQTSVALTEEEIEARTVTRTPTQRLDADGNPLEPPHGHGGRPQVE